MIFLSFVPSHKINRKSKNSLQFPAGSFLLQKTILYSIIDAYGGDFLKTSESLKQEKIDHLNFCLEKLQIKLNGYNDAKITRLYRRIYSITNEIQKLDAEEALEYFNKCVNNDVRDELLYFNIDLTV